MLGPVRVIKQGKRKTSEGQFHYQSGFCQDSEVSVHLCFFRNAFATISIVDPRGDRLPEIKALSDAPRFAPGWLKNVTDEGIAGGAGRLPVNVGHMSFEVEGYFIRERGNNEHTN